MNVYEPIIGKRITIVRNKLKELGSQKWELQKQLAALGLTENQKKKGIADERTLLVRDQLKDAIEAIEKEVPTLRDEFRQLHLAQDSGKVKHVINIMKEIFPEEQLIQIYKEADRRMDNEPPIPIGLNFKELARYKSGYYSCKDLASEQLNKMIEFRILLTAVIEKGCQQFGDAEFMKVISPLNKLIIPLDDLKKIKRKHFL